MEAEQDLGACVLCGARLRRFIDKIEDWEYGVLSDTRLVICPDCRLVTHHPRVAADQIPRLYPENYLAHSGASAGRGIYGRLKAILARRAARGILRLVPPGGVILEVGCGNGHLFRQLAELRDDLHFIGVDIEKVDIDDIPNFTFLHGQLHAVEVAAESADLIYFSNLIEHVEDPRVFLQTCARILRPNGSIYGVTPDHLSLDRYIFGRYWAGYHYPRHTFVFNHHNLPRLLREEGFTAVRVRGSYAFWYLSLANRFLELPGLRKRGLAFAAVTAFFLPLDLVLNLFTCHGSMTFTASTLAASRDDSAQSTTPSRVVMP